MNIKRALKNLGKMGLNIYYQHLDNGLTLLSDSHIVINVYTEEFNNLKDECFKKNVFKEYNLLELFELNKNKRFKVKKTPLCIELDDGRVVSVFKSTEDGKNVFTGIDKSFIDIINDIYLVSWQHLYKPMEERLCPIIHAQWAYDEFYGGFMILPVNTDIQNTVKDIMELTV